jgi:uncharacterized protein (TIGR01777 family)
MRVVIAAGTGQIGRALSRNLTSEGHEVIVLSRNPERATNLPAGVRVAPWDARTGAGWVDLADGADAIVNLAGANLAGEGFFPIRWTPERKRVLRDSRVNDGLAVVDAVERARAKPGVLIQASAIGVYGARADEIVTEEASPGRDFLARLTSAEWEPSTAPVEQMGVRRAVIRSGVVLSPTEGALYRLLLPYRLFVGGPMGSGKQWFSWIHPVDHIAGILFLIEHQEARGLFNDVQAADHFWPRRSGPGRPSAYAAWVALKPFGEASSVL